MDETDLMTAEPSAPVIPAATDRDQWFDAMEERCLEEGYFEPLGRRHWAWFHDDGPTLLVTFETIDSILARPDRLSAGHAIASTRGWSHLCVISDGETWFRDEAVYRYFDRLVDDSFFEDFDRVTFYGAGSAGYAAAAFSVAAPGATVLAVSPRATMLPALAGWDARDIPARRLDFTSRYGYAPDMVEGAGQVFVIYDPFVREDAMHAALFRAPHVHLIRTRHLGAQAEDMLNGMMVLPRILTAAGEGRLDPVTFARHWRRRGRNGAYMDGLLAHAEAKGNIRRAWVIAREAAMRTRAPRFRKATARLAAALDIADAEAISG